MSDERCTCDMCEAILQGEHDALVVNLEPDEVTS